MRMALTASSMLPKPVMTMTVTGKLPLLDAFDQLHAVEVRHLQVGQHDAVVVLRQRVQGRLPVGHGVDRKLPPGLQ